MRVFFDRDLDTVATFWRIYRIDGATLGFTTHDKDLYFSGIRHRAAPGMIPASIKRTIGVGGDNAEVEGTISHDNIREEDLTAGLFDRSTIEIGAVDWGTLEHSVLYSGRLGEVLDGQQGFTAELSSAKSILENDFVPRTSPTCRAEFCGRGCNLSAVAFTEIAELSSLDLDRNTVVFAGLVEMKYVGGTLRFLDGPQTGLKFGIVASEADGLLLDRPLMEEVQLGSRAQLREGCDHTIATCSTRFDNAVNFRGEAHLPGNDLLARYGSPQA